MFINFKGRVWIVDGVCIAMVQAMCGNPVFQFPLRTQECGNSQGNDDWARGLEGPVCEVAVISEGDAHHADE